MSKMRAVVQNVFGGPEVLTLIRDALIPEPILTEVQVCVSDGGRVVRFDTKVVVVLWLLKISTW